MNKKKSFLGLYLIIAFVMIVTAVIVSLTAGINLGIDVGGGTQFEVVITPESGSVTNKFVQKQEDIIKDVLKDNGLYAEKIFVQDKDSHVFVVVRIADDNITNRAEIVGDLVSALEIEEEAVSEFSIISGSLTKKSVIWASIAIVCILLAVFVFGWIRYKLMSGLTLTFSVLLALMLSVALHIITRLPITFNSIIIMLCSAVLILFALIFVLEKVREISKSKSSENMEVAEIISTAKKRTLLPLICLVAMIFVMAVVFVFIPVTYVQLTACSVIVCLVSIAYTYYFIAVSLHEKLLEIKDATEKARLSRDNSPAPQPKKAVRPKSAKKLEPKKAKKAEDNKIEV